MLFSFDRNMRYKLQEGQFYFGQMHGSVKEFN